MKKKIIVIISITTISIISFFIFSKIASEIVKDKTPKVTITNSDGKDIIVKVEVADTSAKQVQGLSDRESLEYGQGMLFVFSDKQIRSFWMKNMHFPLDIIWLEDDRVVHISKDLPPEGENPSNHYSSKYKINYVLEVPANFAEATGIKVGDKIFYNY